MLSRDEFAEAVLIQLATRGETTAVYDAASFTIWRKPNENSQSPATGHSKLDRWYEKYQAAAPQGRGDEALAEFVDHYFDSLEDPNSAELPNKARLIPLVRSRFDFEVTALRSAVKNQDSPGDWMNVFVHQPLAEHLDIYVSEDLPEGYRHVARPALVQLGMSWDEALRLAMWNLPQIDPGFRPGEPFAQQPQGHWSYIAPPSELFTSWLLFPEKIRRIPVKGKHVAFLPKVAMLAITGSEEIDVLRILATMTVQALKSDQGRAVTAVPFILEPSGWKPWLPPPRHPLYWTIKELHIASLADMYHSQAPLLKEHYRREQGDDAPHVAEYTGTEFEAFRGQSVLSDWSLWTQWVHTILPRTEAVVLLQLLNPDELNSNPNAKEQFGEQITITWKQLAEYLGPRLKKLDYYPERYQVVGDDFPEGDDWNRLMAAQVVLPLEGKPGTPPEPMPKLVPMTTANTSSPSVSFPTQLAKPFTPPPELKPPPEPSLWPLVMLGLFGLTCLGGGVGVLVLGIQWIHSAVTATRPADLAAAAIPPAAQPIQPFPPQRPLPIAADPPDLPDPAADPEAFRAAMRQALEQFQRDIDRGALDVSPLEPAPEPLPAEPPPETIPPLPPLEKPQQELPLLSFGPADVEPLGREIHGDHLFQDVAPAGGWLVGLRATKGKPWNGAIVALQPIYQVGGEYQLGQQCGGGVQALEHVQLLAKPGYAVGKIEARLGLIMNAVRIEFYRVDGESLIPADAYATDWIGAEGGSPQTFDGHGSPLVGLAGSFEPRGELITIQVLRKK